MELEGGEEAAEGGASSEKRGEGEVVGEDGMGMHGDEEGESSLRILRGILGNEGVPMEGVVGGDGALVPSASFAAHHMIFSGACCLLI